VQKRVRQVTQRRAPQERRDPAQATKPQDLKESDLDNQNPADLVKICEKIHHILIEAQAEAEKKVTREIDRLGEEPSSEMAKDIMEKHGIADDGGVPLFRFCFNPKSFGQTVENLFYVSFLIRDGIVGISMDSDDLPTLRMFLTLPSKEWFRHANKCSCPIYRSRNSHGPVRSTGAGRPKAAGCV
jgi:hypothetical protein